MNKKALRPSDESQYNSETHYKRNPFAPIPEDFIASYLRKHRGNVDRMKFQTTIDERFPDKHCPAPKVFWFLKAAHAVTFVPEKDGRQVVRYRVDMTTLPPSYLPAEKSKKSPAKRKNRGVKQVETVESPVETETTEQMTE